MWLVHNTSGEEGWYIPQENQRGICPLLVFVKDKGIWRTKLWISNETRIRPKKSLILLYLFKICTGQKPQKIEITVYPRL